MNFNNLRVPAVITPDDFRNPPQPEEGTAYNVEAERVILREGPSQNAVARGLARKGDQVLLFSWDESRLWRRAWVNKSGWGWMLLDHPEYGPLLRPKGRKLCGQPLEPMCVAAMENMPQDLRRFIDQGLPVNVEDKDGMTPVMLAANRNHLECCVVLAIHGADVKQAIHDNTSGSGQRDRLTRALLSALNHEYCNAHDFEDALIMLPLQAQAEADKFSAQGRARRAEALAEATSGEQYEVVFESVWVRREPTVTAEKITRRFKGEIVTLRDFDADGSWGCVHIQTSEGKQVGWMKVSSEQGDLLRPVAACEDSAG